ncbi:hypothetical protein [Leptolyngbya sp. FACHB-261]|uniref:hypothetical protein n=1 Tax=Leptolyngbya sp. FACHB-261 TaxID=2692806 RepID=UPI001687F9D7|nr:hypothetical protein [Leptolyngbya sp. FACHB-261]MBD2100682.1 hypothetical protein [Leptolyngbya sp. FACHB-261]
MDTRSEDLSPNPLLQLIPLALSFADDAVLLGLSRLGLPLLGLSWLSSALLGFTLVYWMVRLLKQILRFKTTGLQIHPVGV